MRFAFAAAVAMAFAVPLPALSQSDAALSDPSPARDAAIAAWLADDEAAALSALAELARAGDVPSALLLSALELRLPETPYRAGLSPEARRDLFRAPGSAFGTPWVDSLPADAAPEVRRALKGIRARDWAAALTAALAARDMALAREAVLGFANDDPLHLFAFDRATPLPSELRPVLWLTAGYLAARVAGDSDVNRLLAEMAAAPDGLGLRVAMSAALAEDARAEPQAKALGNLLRTGRASPPPDFATLVEAAALLSAAPEGRTLAALCRDACPDDTDGCVVAGNTAVRGYPALFALNSPLATVIPTDRYRESARARSELLRHAMGAGALLSMLPDTKGGACFATLIPRT